MYFVYILWYVPVHVETIAPVHALLIYFDAAVTTGGSLSDVVETTSDDVYVQSLKTSTLPIHEFYVIVDLSGNCCKLISFIMGF